MRAIFNAIILIIIFSVSLVAFVGFILVPLYIFFVFVGSRKRMEKLTLKIDSTLMPSERKLDQVVEYRIFGLYNRRGAIAITDSRVISIQRKIFGGYIMQDLQWKDLTDVRLEENIFPGLLGTALRFDFLQEGRKTALGLYGVQPEAASQIYGYAQTQEQAWEEKRRIRDLEEKRAKSGGINFHGNPYGQQVPQQSAPLLIPSQTIEASSTDGVVIEINKAKALFESGAITDSEFQEIKSKILSRHFQ